MKQILADKGVEEVKRRGRKERSKSHFQWMSRLPQLHMEPQVYCRFGLVGGRSLAVNLQHKWVYNMSFPSMGVLLRLVYSLSRDDGQKGLCLLNKSSKEAYIYLAIKICISVWIYSSLHVLLGQVDCIRGFTLRQGLPCQECVRLEQRNWLPLGVQCGWGEEDGIQKVNQRYYKG